MTITVVINNDILTSVEETDRNGVRCIKLNFQNGPSKYQDIKVFVNNKEVLYVKNEGVSSGKLKFIGTNETILNKKTDSSAEGRRPLDYLKFIPKSNELNN